ELAARLKSETDQSFTPVMLVSDRADVSARVSALATVEDVIARPYAPAEVAARIEALLRTRRLVDALRVARAESEARALDDPLTGLRNRLFLIERLHEEWKRSARYNEPLSLLLIAVEGMAELKARRGAEAADRVLTFVAGQTVASLRQIDLVTRHAGGVDGRGVLSRQRSLGAERSVAHGGARSPARAAGRPGIDLPLSTSRLPVPSGIAFR